jgi:hypothetical protein
LEPGGCHSLVGTHTHFCAHVLARKIGETAVPYARISTTYHLISGSANVISGLRTRWDLPAMDGSTSCFPPREASCLLVAVRHDRPLNEDAPGFAMVAWETAERV